MNVSHAGKHTVQRPFGGADLWRMYWRGWGPWRLWRYQLLAGLLVAALVRVLRGWASMSVFGFAVLALAVGALCAVLLPLPFMVSQKPGTHTFTITAEGWFEGSIFQPWRQVRCIEERRRGIYIASGEYRAFFIPWRAFPRLADREEFLADARAWYRAAGGAQPPPSP
jgi:hypothetical protein